MIARRRWFTAAVLLTTCLLGSTAQATDLSGYWEGRWGSTTTPHNGPLTATFCKISSTQYQVNFKGRFFKILPFRYSVVLNVVSDDGRTVHLRGSSYLGRMFGTFYYHATVTNNCFSASYSSCKDRGWFKMTRCSTCN